MLCLSAKQGHLEQHGLLFTCSHCLSACSPGLHSSLRGSESNRPKHTCLQQRSLQDIVHEAQCAILCYVGLSMLSQSAHQQLASHLRWTQPPQACSSTLAACSVWTPQSLAKRVLTTPSLGALQLKLRYAMYVQIRDMTCYAWCRSQQV